MAWPRPGDAFPPRQARAELYRAGTRWHCLQGAGPNGGTRLHIHMVAPGRGRPPGRDGWRPWWPLASSHASLPSAGLTLVIRSRKRRVGRKPSSALAETAVRDIGTSGLVLGLDSFCAPAHPETRERSRCLHSHLVAEDTRGKVAGRTVSGTFHVGEPPSCAPSPALAWTFKTTAPLRMIQSCPTERRLVLIREPGLRP